MVNRRATTDASVTTAPLQSIAPVVKRKRRASCLGEQERRERKRAIDREAQRSLREKTKTHIAELERTIEILRNQDRNGATASLLAEIEGLRAENERLRDVIDGVRNVIGGEMFGRMPPAATAAAGGVAGGRQEEGTIGSPAVESAGQSSPRLRRDSYSQVDVKPPASLPSPEATPDDPQDTSDVFSFTSPMPPAPTVDLDGMSVIPLSHASSAADAALDLSLSLSTAVEDPSSTSASTFLSAPDSPTTAAFAPFIQEIFGSPWNCPSPIVLHIDNPASPNPPSSNPPICPIWRRSNELFSKIFSCRLPGSAGASSGLDIEHGVEAGMLFQGIKDGWDSFDAWRQSPVLKILKSVDQHLFARSGNMERLAAAYKSFKLLKYYANPTKSTLTAVPPWLRPTPLQTTTQHPIAIDFFAWPPLRDRLIHTHHTLFRTSLLSHAYAAHLRFDWPFSFEDTFFFDEGLGGWWPSPLFERFHGEVGRWTVGEGFWRGLEGLRGDILGEGCR